jgi:sialidase-1
MKIPLFICIVLCATSTYAAGKEILHQKQIYVSGMDEVNIYRIPSLIVTQKGVILAFCEARKGGDKSPTDLVLKRSLNNGKTWEIMRTVLSGEGGAIMNPTPIVDRRDGTIWMVCNFIYRSRKIDQLWVLKSMDEGLTWSKPIDITSMVGSIHCGPGIGIQLQSGRFVIPGRSQDNRGQALVIYSDDHGGTWKAGAGVAPKTNESQVVELADGSLMLNMRSTRGKRCRYVAISRDGGTSWDEHYDDEALIEPVCQGSIIRLTQTNGGLGRNRLLFSNPASNKGRKNGTIKLSYDEGKTWPIARTLYPGGYAYSCLTTLPDGTIACLSEHDGYKNITFSRFTLEWLTKGADKLEGNQ